MIDSPYKRPPRLQLRAPAWAVDDVVTVGSTRWIIRILNDDGHVELEASSVAGRGIWWRSTLENLPEKVTA